jgi:hypothetical protein
LQCLFACQIAADLRLPSNYAIAGRGIKFFGVIASAKCAETNAGMPNLHRFVIEFCMNMVAGLWEGENHASATAADRHNRLCFVFSLRIRGQRAG